MTPVEIQSGEGPVVLAFPHVGTHVPEGIRADMNAEGLVLRDTDWNVFELYDGLLSQVTTVRATFHRYVIDANRDPSGESLYPGQTTTGLVPHTTFDNVPIWREEHEPSMQEVARRVAAFHAPYHAALAAELDRVRRKHGIAILFDCHSIRSAIPWLFEGVLPDFNIGTDGGKTCAAALETAVHEICRASDQTTVLNGRFRGGWTTRHYGRPEQGIHAIQMELAQSSHLSTEAPPFDLNPEKATALRIHLAAILHKLSDLALSQPQ